MTECKCDMRTKLVGDGCEVCNPGLALTIAKERIAELERELAAVTRQRDETWETLGRERKEWQAHKQKFF